MSELWDIYDINRKPTGRTVERGKPMKSGEYHIVVNVWIRNSKGEWLISKRTPNKHFPLLWEPTGGSAVSGESSFDAAIRETREELGVELDPIFYLQAVKQVLQTLFCFHISTLLSHYHISPARIKQV